MVRVMAGITTVIVSDALRRGKADKPQGDLKYIRFKEEFKGIARGTVIIGSRVIHGYPHIKRIFTLEKGVLRNLPADGENIFVEEKIDGFNVRMVSVSGEIYAFSRGGFLDLFVSEKARELDPIRRFFKDRPEATLCGEMLGNTPYTRPSEGGDATVYIFDIDRGDGTLLPCDERYSLVEKYGLRGVPVIGRFGREDIAGLKRVILSLNKGRKEGMVLKTRNRGMAVKYVTPWSDIDDISSESFLFFDMPIGFYYQRVLRSSFFISDFGLDKRAHAEKLGLAFYDGLEKAIRAAKEGVT